MVIEAHFLQCKVQILAPPNLKGKNNGTKTKY
nr:MAG TPA: hypothetical protein [Caudoviricetes sp.]